jgi:hypothetical protein
MKGESKDEYLELCSVCGENQVIPGKDLCLTCLKEISKSNEAVLLEARNTSTEEDALELGTTNAMDEITLDMDSTIPPREFGDMTRQLSLEEAIEKEKNDNDEDNADE